MTTRQARDHGSPDLGGDFPHGVGIGRRCNREPGLDDVHTQGIELTRQLQLLGGVKRKSRRLLAVPQRRVEDPYVLFVHRTPLRECPLGQ